MLTNKLSPLTCTASLAARERCEHMLVLLDDRTWTSGETTDAFVKEIESGMAAGVHMLCVHEFPSVVGPPRHECDFALMFRSDWTPDHLQGGATNLYKEIALALKGAEWRDPGLVAFASKIAASGAAKPTERRSPSNPTLESVKDKPTQALPPPVQAAAPPLEAAAVDDGALQA